MLFACRVGYFFWLVLSLVCLPPISTRVRSSAASELYKRQVYMLSKEFRNQHKDVEWDVIEGMRHVLVHGYYQIRPTQLWNTIQQDIPVLKPQIESLLDEEAKAEADVREH